MFASCLAGLGWLPIIPSLAFVVVSLLLARHWAGGSSNDGLLMEDYRFRLMEQFCSFGELWNLMLRLRSPGVTSVPVMRPR
jgi:hypothetical protein